MGREYVIICSVMSQIEYVECSLARREAITHNTCLLVLQVPDNTRLPVPVGHHVYLRSPNKGVWM